VARVSGAGDVPAGVGNSSRPRVRRACGRSRLVLAAVFGFALGAAACEPRADNTVVTYPGIVDRPPQSLRPTTPAASASGGRAPPAAPR
jgi:hypothetical protein